MAFVQTSNPESLYELLKLHHTNLNGRRMNVEKSAGGGKTSEKRKTKIGEFREEQKTLINETVDKILEEFYLSGSIVKGELDDGVIGLAKRHSANTVQQALDEYVESRGDDLSNPSSYLTAIIGRVSTEGIENSEADRKWHKVEVVEGGKLRRTRIRIRIRLRRRRPKNRINLRLELEIDFNLVKKCYLKGAAREGVPPHVVSLKNDIISSSETTPFLPSHKFMPFSFVSNSVSLFSASASASATLIGCSSTPIPSTNPAETLVLL